MKKAIVAWGRMNPPTIGHQKLVDRVVAIAKRERGEPRVYLTHTQNPKKDPLQYRDKIRIATRAFGRVVKVSGSRTIIELMKELQNNGYKEVVVVAGSDRVPEYKALLNKYNGKDYTFDNIKVVSAGERDPDAEGAEGMSATKMRQAASDSDEKSFHSGAPTGLSKADKTKLYNLVRKGMLVEEIELFMEKVKKSKDINDKDISDTELKKAVDQMEEELLDDEYEEEQLDERAPLTIQQRMKKSRQMKRLAPKMKRLRQIKKFRMAPTERLQTRARRLAKNILRKKFAGSKGGRYASLSPSEKITVDRLVANKGPVIEKLAKRLLPMMRKKEIERIRQARKSKNESVEQFVEKTDVNKMFKNLFEGEATQAARERIKREKEQDKAKHDRMLDQARSTDTRAANRKEEFELTDKSRLALETKARKSNIDYDIIEQVYFEGIEAWKQNPRKNVTAEQWAYARVNTFIANEGLKDPKDNPCWDGYKPVGTKKKNGKTVPNCVPEGKAHSTAQQAAIAIAKKERGEYKENFMDGKGPGKPGDAARHGLKGKSPTQLRKIRSSDSASPRKKQLAHWLLNFVHKEETQMLDESLQIEKGAGIGTFMTASDYGFKFQGAYEHHPSVVDEEGGAGEYGTKKLKDKYTKETPGQ